MITIQIRDEDLELLHFDIGEHCWESDVIYLNNASFVSTSPDVITCDKSNIVGIDNIDDYNFSVWIGERLLIKNTSTEWKIVDASLNDDVLSVTVDLDGRDYIFPEDTTGIECQLYGYTSVILDAFNTLRDDLLDRGYSLDAITATSVFRDAQRYKTLERIFKQITNDVTDDKWGKLAMEYERKYNTELTNTNIASATGEVNTLGVRIQL